VSTVSNVTQRDGATIATVHRQKALLLQALDDMVNNPFAKQHWFGRRTLRIKGAIGGEVRVRFTTTADGIRCEAAVMGKIPVLL
jgi:hypothetical protein